MSQLVVMTTIAAIEILQKLPYFTKANLALAFNLKKDNFNYWLKKLTADKLLIPVKKGFYISNLYPKSEAYWEQLANVIRSPSYISLEYALAKYGLIPESPSAITSITLKSPRSYSIQNLSFIYRNLKPSLFSDFETSPIYIAKPYKALFDYLYLRPQNLDNRINWDALSEENRQNFKNLVIQSRSIKLKKYLSQI